MDTKHIEICCNSIQSAANAKAAGAARIELCQDLSEGGTTPSYATIKQCVGTLHLAVFALIRPRSGDFCYNDLEFQNILDDIQLCKTLGVAGVVVGFLHSDGSIEKELTRKAVAAARPMQITFHRAFDDCKHWPTALEDIIDCGCDRILTSGCHPTAMEGSDNLRDIIKQAGNRIAILAGSGVTPQNVQTLVHKTGVKEVHASCKQTLADGRSETSSEFVKQLIHQCYEL